MHASITVTKVFDTAIMLERNGGIFYRRAAQFAATAPLRRRLLELADAERVHMQTFLKLKDLIANSPDDGDPRDPDPQAARYLQVFVQSGLFNLEEGAAQALAADADMREILEFAAARERDSIMFYLGVKEGLLQKAVRDKIDAIIYEEMSHVVLLDQELRKLSEEEGQPGTRRPRTAFSVSD
jgi:rubrerythrin